MIAPKTDLYLQILDNVRDLSQQGKTMKAVTVIVQFLDKYPNHPEGLHLFGTLLIEAVEQLKLTAHDEQKDGNGSSFPADIKAKWNGIVSDAEKNDAVKVTDVFQKLMAGTSNLEVENLLSEEVGLALSSLLTRTSVISFRRAIKLGAGPSTVKDLATIFIAEGRVDEAAKIIADGIAKNPDDVMLLAFQAKIFDIMDMPEDADSSRLLACVLLINKRETTLGATSMEIKIATKFSKDIAKAGNGDEAERIMKINMSRHPAIVGQLVEQAWTFHYSGLNELACETAYKAGIMAPQRKDVRALLEKTVFAKIGEPDRLNELLRSAISSPDGATAFYSLGNALYDNGRHMEAVAAFRMALRYKPDYVEALRQIISIVHYKKYREAAITMSESLIDIAPNDPLVHIQHGDLMSQSGRPMDAVISYRKAAKLDPSITDVHRTIGKQLLSAGRLKESLSAFYSAVSHNSGNYKNLEGLAEVMTLSGHYEDATAWLRKALFLNKNSITLRRELAESLLRCGHWNEGRKYLSAPSHKPRLDKPDWDGSSPILGSLLAFHRPEDSLECTLIGLGAAVKIASYGYTVICECPATVAKIGIPPADGISVIEYRPDNANEIISNANITNSTPLADLILMLGQTDLLLPEWLSAESKSSVDPTTISNVILAHSNDKLSHFPKLDKLFNEIESAITIPAKKISTGAKLSAIATTIKLADAVITDDAVTALISGALGVPSIFIVANNSPWWWGDHHQLSPLAQRQMMIRIDMETETEEIIGKVRYILDSNIPPHTKSPRMRPSTYEQPRI